MFFCDIQLAYTACTILKNFHCDAIIPVVKKFSGALRLTLTIAERVTPFVFETNRLFFVRSLLKLLSRIFCSVQLCNLNSRNFYYDAMQQYRCSNFSDVFCLNCIFVIDAAALMHLVSRSFLKYGVSAGTMAAHKIIFKKSNSIFTVLLVSLNQRFPTRGP